MVETQAEGKRLKRNRQPRSTATTIRHPRRLSLCSPQPKIATLKESRIQWTTGTCLTDESTVLDAARRCVARVAHGPVRRASRYGCALASPMALSPVDATLKTGPSWPPAYDGPSCPRDEIAAANPLWGAPRIHGELGKLGVAVSERTVSRLVRRPQRPPSQTWRTFLTNHVATLGSVDFFTVPTVTGRILFVFVVLLHHRRRTVHFNVTEHPTAAWTAQQLVDAFPDDTPPRWLLRDRDAIYGDDFRRRVAGMGLDEVIQVHRAPGKPIRRARDRFNPAGMSRACDRARRAAFAAHLDPLRRLLSWGANTSFPGQGLTHAPTRTDADGRARRGVRGSWWTTPSVRTTRGLTLHRERGARTT